MPRGIPKNGINKGWFKAGVPHTDDFKRKISRKLKGIKRSTETKLKMSLAQRGHKRRMGYKHTEEAKQKISLAHQGDKAYNWMGGITPLRKKLYFSEKYKKWRKGVFERDGYRCVIGGSNHGNKIQADHIKPWALYPKLRFSLKNGRTLCEVCHKQTKTYGTKLIKSKIYKNYVKRKKGRII